MSRPVRILHCVGAMTFGGIETWLMHVLRNIDRNHYQLDFLTTTEAPAYHDDEIRSLGSRILPCPHHRNPLAFAHQMRRIVRDHGAYDVLHSHHHYYSGYVLRVAEGAGIPIRIAHSHTRGTPHNGISGLPRRCYEALMRHWIWQYCTTGIGVSTVAADSLFGSRWRSDARFLVLPCGFDFSCFRCLPGKEAAKVHLGIPANRKVIGHIGSFVQVKNHMFLLDVFRSVLERGEEAHLLMVGEGPLAGSVEARLSARGHRDYCTMAGAQRHVAPYLAAMDAFVLPSLYEGLAAVVLEAQAAGVPVLVSSDVPEEADVIPGLVERHSLEAGTEYWAQKVLDCLHRQKDGIQPVTCNVDVLQASHVGLQRCLRALMNIYSHLR